MALYRVQIGFPMDSALPRDVVTINPHFKGDAPQALADALAVNMAAVPEIGGTSPFTIKVYDALKAPPSYPLATKVQGTGFWTASKPKEVALCLSYYAAFNRPHSRGRLYIPAQLIPGDLGRRPTGSQMDNVLQLASIFTTGLPSGHVWNTYSPRTGASEPVTDIWCDDEWDTVRSRGSRPTTRHTQHIGP